MIRPFMDPASPIPAIASMMAALATSFLIVKFAGPPPAQGRYASIDGLRGYMAFFVFLTHACVWYFYLKTGKWQAPPSRLYTHFGESSVSFFFMITGFLFCSKLIDGRKRGIDWSRLFISRFLRLLPLYLFAMLCLFMIVSVLSDWAVHEPLIKLAKEAFRWVNFTVFGAPDINGIQHTYIIIAAVTWTLTYEWLFYFSLPILAFAIGATSPIAYILLSVMIVTGLILHMHPQIYILLPFLGGIAAAFLAQNPVFRRLATSAISSLAAIACICATVAFFPTAYQKIPLLLLSVAFCLIACGNDIFGLLTNHASRTLGQMSYSIYLLHGITLFIFFNFLVGPLRSKALSPEMYWMLVVGITPLLIVLCLATFRLIEWPVMQRTNIVAFWLRSRFKG